MTQYLNQFAQAPEKGMLDLRLNANTVSVRANNTTILAGQAVKLVDVAYGVPHVAPALDTDEVFGYANRSLKKTTFTGYDDFEVSITGNVMYMESGAAIAANADIMYVKATGYVITATGTTKCISGKALDKASAINQLIRVYIKSFPTLARPAT